MLKNWSFTISASRLWEHHGSYSSFNYKTQKDVMKFLVVWNVKLILWPSLSNFIEVFGLAEIVAQDSRLGADGFQFCRESISSQQYVAVQLHSRNFLLVHLLCQSSLLLSPFNMPSWQFIPRRKLRGRLGLVQGTTKISRLLFDSNLILSWQYIYVEKKEKRSLTLNYSQKQLHIS